MTLEEYKQLNDRQKWETRVSHAFAIFKANGYDLLSADGPVDRDHSGVEQINHRRIKASTNGQFNFINRLGQKRIARARMLERAKLKSESFGT